MNSASIRSTNITEYITIVVGLARSEIMIWVINLACKGQRRGVNKLGIIEE